MERRQFLTASITASALAITGEGVAEGRPAEVREYYQIRRYALQRGPQLALTETYFAETLIPALTRMGMGPVGAFTLTFGPETPTYYLVIPSPSLESLVNLDLRLAQDVDFLQTANFFLECDGQGACISARGSVFVKGLRRMASDQTPAHVRQ